MAPLHPPPSFFIILIDHSAPHAEIPRDFVSKHLKKKLPKDPIIRSANGGYSWQLKIKKIGENYCFAHGWNNVVKDIKLGFGDFLFFRLVDQSTFKMFVYGLNGCQKILPPKINIEVDDDDDDDVSEDVVVDDDDVDDEDEDDDEDEVDDEDDEDEDIDDDDDDDDDNDDDNDDNDDDDDADDNEEDDIDGDIDGDDGDPFFTKTITKTHKNIMRLNPMFVGLMGIDDERPITIRNRDGKEWPMELRLDKMYKRYYLTSGWCKFVRNNDLSKGDKCVFKFITSEDKLCLVKVTRKRSAVQRPPRHKIPAKEVPIEHCGGGGDDLENEDECGEVVKRSRGRPPKRGRGRPAQQKNGVV